MRPRDLRKLFIYIPIITLVACTSVGSFVKEGDYRGLNEFCNAKPTSPEKEICFAEGAKASEKERPEKAYDLYMQLGKDTGNIAYYDLAGDLASSLIERNSKMTEKAVRAFEASNNKEGAITAVTKQSTRMIWGQKNLPWDTVKKTAEKYQIIEVFENLADMALSRNGNQENHKLYAAEYYEKAGKMEKAKKLYFEVAHTKYNKKYYASAASAFAKGGDQKAAVESWLKAASTDLNARNPNYKSALSNYEKAGKAEEGKRLVSTKMIEKRDRKIMVEGLEMAKEISAEFYNESLILAGTVYFPKSQSTARAWFKEAGVDDPYAKMAEVYLAKDPPNLRSAETSFVKSKRKDYGQLMLKRAIEVNNLIYMVRFEFAAETPEQHEKVAHAILKAQGLANISKSNKTTEAATRYNKAYAHFKQSNIENGGLIIAEKVSGNINKLLAPKFYYLGGEKEKGLHLWTEAVNWVIESQQFYPSYLTLEETPKELMDIYWKQILEHFREKNSVLAMAPLNLLEIDQPALAMGFIQNQYRWDALTTTAMNFSKGKGSPYSRDLIKKYTAEAAVNAQFNKLLVNVSKRRSPQSPKIKEAFTELEQAQLCLIRRDFKNMEKHMQTATSSFGM